MALPQLYTLREVIRGVPRRWCQQYSQGPLFTLHHQDGPSTQEVCRQLRALNLETATRADIAAIIGNDSWCGLSCDGCGKQVETVIIVGDDSGESEARYAYLCVPCLSDAAALLPK